MQAKKEQPFACLWNTKVSRVHNLRMHTILAFKFEVFDDLFAHTHLVHARDVFHNESGWLRFPNNSHKLSIERIARVFNEPCVVTYLRECLAWRPANNDVGTLSELYEAFTHPRRTQVPANCFSLRKISTVRRNGIWIMVAPSEDLVAGHGKPFADTSGPTK